MLVRDKGYIESGSHITVMIPMKDSSGRVQALLCVQRQMDGMTLSRRSYVENVSLVLIILAIIVIIGQGIYLHKSFLGPVKKITAEAARFADENAVKGSKLIDTIKNTDEIGVLADSIDKMESRIEKYIDHIGTITAEKERINTELSLATRIQYGMLPHTFPAFPDNKEFDIYASMDPAKEVGGDFYDFFMTDDTHLCMVMADVSGKGVPAALFMMATKIMLAINAKTGKSPAEILEDANNRICANEHEEMFVTVWLGMQERNQRLFQGAIIVFTSAKTLTELEENVEKLKGKARSFGCELSPIACEQEAGLNATLPLAKNDIGIRRTLTTAAQAIFIPFTTQELADDGGMYYGLNALSRNLIFFNRKALKNPAGFVLGSPGSGKSFATKRCLVDVMLNSEDDEILVIDPEAEYLTLFENFGGEIHPHEHTRTA